MGSRLQSRIPGGGGQYLIKSETDWSSELAELNNNKLNEEFSSSNNFTRRR